MPNSAIKNHPVFPEERPVTIFHIDYAHRNLIAWSGQKDPIFHTPQRMNAMMVFEAYADATGCSLSQAMDLAADYRIQRYKDLPKEAAS